ncbi:DJ-1/PfpI family protein [Serratia entomophila]|uniref:DJ-1/PfpI family protein n=1 Tax=Serratia entomophila TaxID=42906 RepID=UPI00217B1C9B|nr:DJ-1/PfpI family protein [Serratia entomophila]CAI0717350.1 Uncharacterized protease ydeA [Serratia entomophila]CAI0717881.1 Uncharacterized protease ydeA [Serratia entomophila]CAI0718825.1 Uncharacterized protease ydeA [Serratia entomophila]CAI0861865.1 Uncharacterized protease ydeA [Serratia entomophila]CAI1545334.1 Uncharacterized protease ydeA [Serratia entomophila]
MTKKTAVIMTPGFADWEYALIAGIGGPFYGLDVAFFSPQVGRIRSQGGLVCEVSKGLDELAAWQPDAVVVVGGTLWESEQAPDIGALLKTQHLRGVTIAGICGGTLALARAGLLNGRKHTSNEVGFLTRNAKNYTGEPLFVASAAAVADVNVITAPGTAPVSFTAAIFSALGIDEATVKQFNAMLAAEHA